MNLSMRVFYRRALYLPWPAVEAIAVLRDLPLEG